MFLVKSRDYYITDGNLFQIDVSFNSNDENYKKRFPDMSASEYLITKANPDIKPQRLINILSGKAKRITLQELCIICYWLDIELKDLFKNIE